MKDEIGSSRAMNFFFLTLSLIFFEWNCSIASSSLDPLLNSEKLQLTNSDYIIGEHIVNMLKFTETGYINHDVISKVLVETRKSKHFNIFVPWLQSIFQISKVKKTADLITLCGPYAEKKQTLPLERRLERVAGNYCRERTLEAIGRDIEKFNVLSDEANIFIQENLKFFLTKKNKKNFAFFIQTQASRPEILKKLSQEVTSYSVRHEIVPAQEVLKDIVINEQITKLIQDKGFNPLQHQNVFYAEYGKLIENGYKSIDTKSNDNKAIEEKIKEQYHFLKNYLELNQNHLPLSLCLSRLNDFAKAVFRAGLKDLSRDIFKFIIRKNHKEIYEDALFFYLWTHLYYNEFKEAQKVANMFGLVKNNKKISDARLKFWIAYLQEETGNSSTAITMYEEIILNNPLSYYGIMSTKKLQMLKPDSPGVSFYKNNSLATSGPTSLELKNLDSDHISSLVRLKAWAKIDSAKFMKYELKRLNNYSIPSFLVNNSTEKQIQLKSELHLLNAKIIQNAENYLATFRYLYQVLEKKEVIFNRKLLEVLYPQPYLDVLTKILKYEKIDPIILLSLIRQESVFNPLARSAVGARGLMQIMPTTARRLRRSVGDKQLVNPQINIELGTKYVKNLLRRYNGNLVYVLAAYNAGESRVERWKSLYFDSDESILKNIEAIPFLETRNYVKLIFRNIFFYKLLIDRKEEVADSRDPNKIFDVYLGFNK
jgi:soluble lytic murein transglycosylase